MSEKLTIDSLQEICNECFYAIVILERKKTHHNGLVMLILLDLKTKIEKKMCGLIKDSYKLKLTAIEKKTLLYIRNELVLNEMLHSHAVDVLLQLNK